MEAATKYKLTFSTSWDGDFAFGFYDIEDNHVFAMGRSTGSWADFPDSVKAGKTYEYIFDWKHPSQAVYLHIEKAPPISNWTVSISRIGALTVTPKPEVDITVVVEYKGKWNGELKGGSGIVTSGDQSLVWENIEVPVEYTARKMDGLASPLVLKILYNGQVVAQDTAMGEDNEASVFWEGPR